MNEWMDFPLVDLGDSEYIDCACEATEGPWLTTVPPEGEIYPSLLTTEG